VGIVQALLLLLLLICDSLFAGDYGALKLHMTALAACSQLQCFEAG